MAIIHWLGAGLSSGPGIKRLISRGSNVWLWNRTLAKAEEIINGAEGACQAHTLDWQALAQHVSEGDVLVSMLPGSFHVQAATLALDKKAHFVSSSYLSPEMHALHAQALDKGLCLVNEVGLDPGIDHLLAHALVAGYRQSDAYDEANVIQFRSFCGGLPAKENDFKYKFSWSPLGVLTALRSPAKWLENSSINTNNRPWLAMRSYKVALSKNHTDTFEAIPNRDSIPFIRQYHFDPKWHIDTFIRGSLRLNGWSLAWKDIFSLVANAKGDAGTAALSAKSDELWQKYAFKAGEQDRVVLHVDLVAKNKDTGLPVWHNSYAMDAYGSEKGSAMARLVSTTVSMAVESVLAKTIKPGVSAAPDHMAVVNDWMSYINDHHDLIHHLNHLD